MTRAAASVDLAKSDPGGSASGTGPNGQWRRSALIGVVGIAYFAALFFNMETDGGREAALFFGTIGFAFSYPILLLLGRLLAAVLKRIRPLGNHVRVAITVAPAMMLAGMLAYEGYRARDPVTKFERWIVSPAPAGLTCLSAYTYKGMNYWDWAFRFTISPDDLPKILARRPYRHEEEPVGFDLAQVRANGRFRHDYPIPPPNFKAVHRYQFHAPTRRVGCDVTLYGDASQTEFFAYGYVE